jgi:hypothetical protein
MEKPSNKKKGKWGNIRSLNSDIEKWSAFVEKHHLGSFPEYVKNAIIEAIKRDKKRLSK